MAYADDLKENGTDFDTYRIGFDDVDRAICEGNTDGWVEVFTKQGDDALLGATVVGPHAGDLLVPFVIGMHRGIGLGKLGAAVLPYPTRGEVVRKLADQYNRTKLTPLVKGLMGSGCGGSDERCRSAGAGLGGHPRAQRGGGAAAHTGVGLCRPARRW